MTRRRDAQPYLLSTLPTLKPQGSSVHGTSLGHFLLVLTSLNIGAFLQSIVIVACRVNMPGIVCLHLLCSSLHLLG